MRHHGWLWLACALLLTGVAAWAADTLPADRPIADCNIKQPAARNGSAPPLELAKLLIRCLFERPASPGMDGAVTIDLDEVQVGRPRKWVPREDMGSGNVDTMVYPVRAAWTRKQFYRTQTTVNKNESVFNCYVNAFDRWECGLGQRIKSGETTRIPVK